jgi:regulator of nucleoside diphosphate kinase
MKMFATHSRTLTDFDVRRLDALFERIRNQVRPPTTLTVLERELAQAAVVRPEQVPASVVTMNSKVEVVDLASEERRSLTVVFPSLASIDGGCVSVLAPLGAALIGHREGAKVAWQTPRGPRRLRVERVLYQPEAAGRFDL